MKKLFYILFTSISLFSFGQNPLDTMKVEVLYPYKKVVYHNKKSKLPATINVNGKIIDIAVGQCGVLCSGGVIKVRLDKKIDNYNDTCAYIVTACLGHVPIGTTISVTATKLTRNEKECYYLMIDNTFDSKGTPFYKLSEIETNKITATK